MGIRGRKVPPRRAAVLLDRHHPHSASVQCEHPAALRSSAAGSFQAVTPLPPQAPSEESRPSTPRYGFAVVKPGRYSSRPCEPPPSRLRLTKPSGRPGHGRPGRWRRQCQSSQICSATYVAAQNPRCQPQTAQLRPHQRRCLVLLFEGQCLFAKTVVPRIKAGASLTPLGRPGPGRVGRLPTLRAGLFRCSREPEVSLPRRSRARRPHTQDRLRGHAPLRSAPYGTARLLAATRNAHTHNPGG